VSFFKSAEEHFCPGTDRLTFHIEFFFFVNGEQTESSHPLYVTIANAKVRLLSIAKGSRLSTQFVSILKFANELDLRSFDRIIVADADSYFVSETCEELLGRSVIAESASRCDASMKSATDRCDEIRYSSSLIAGHPSVLLHLVRTVTRQISLGASWGQFGSVEMHLKKYFEKSPPAVTLGVAFSFPCPVTIREDTEFHWLANSSVVPVIQSSCHEGGKAAHLKNSAVPEPSMFAKVQDAWVHLGERVDRFCRDGLCGDGPHGSDRGNIEFGLKLEPILNTGRALHIGHICEIGAAPHGYISAALMVSVQQIQSSSWSIFRFRADSEPENRLTHYVSHLLNNTLGMPMPVWTFEYNDWMKTAPPTITCDLVYVGTQIKSPTLKPVIQMFRRMSHEYTPVLVDSHCPLNDRQCSSRRAVWNDLIKDKVLEHGNCVEAQDGGLCGGLYFEEDRSS